jgi:hypothetical protein
MDKLGNLQALVAVEQDILTTVTVEQGLQV